VTNWRWPCRTRSNTARPPTARDSFTQTENGYSWPEQVAPSQTQFALLPASAFPSRRLPMRGGDCCFRYSSTVGGRNTQVGSSSPARSCKTAHPAGHVRESAPLRRDLQDLRSNCSKLLVPVSAAGIGVRSVTTVQSVPTPRPPASGTGRRPPICSSLSTYILDTAGGCARCGFAECDTSISRPRDQPEDTRTPCPIPGGWPWRRHG